MLMLESMAGIKSLTEKASITSKLEMNPTVIFVPETLSSTSPTLIV